MEDVEREFDHTWRAVAERRDSQLQADQAALNSALEEELRVLLHSVRQSLAEDQPELEQEVEKLSSMAQQLHMGVEMWQSKALSGVRAIEEEQRMLGVRVQEAAIRTAARRDDLLRRQQQRAEDAREKCTKILMEAKGQMGA